MASTLTKNINSNYTPTFMSGYPIYAYGGIPHQYGFGSWLKKNAGTVGMLAGAGIGTAIAPGIGTQIGAQIGGQVGGNVQGTYQQNQQQEQQQNALLEQQKRDLVANLPAQHNYTPTFADGGELEPIPSISPILNSYTPQLVDTRNRIYSKDNTFNGKTTYFDEAQRLDAEKKMLESLQNPTFKQQATMNQIPLMKEDLYIDQISKKAMGGKVNFGSNLDNTTVFANGGRHEDNINGGIPLGQNALVEQDEVKFGDYIFSNRIPYKKK